MTEYILMGTTIIVMYLVASLLRKKFKKHRYFTLIANLAAIILLGVLFSDKLNKPFLPLRFPTILILVVLLYFAITIFNEIKKIRSNE